MSVPIIQLGERRDPYAQARNMALGGINQMVEQDVINRMLSRINNQQQDPLTSILGSGLPQNRQNDLVNAFQNQEQIQNKQTQALQKSQPTSDKIGEEFIKNHMEDLELLGNLEQGLTNVQEAIQSQNVSGRLNVVGRYFPSDADQLIKSGTKPFYGLSGKIFGGGSQAKEQTALIRDMYPAPGKSKAENEAGLKVMQEQFDLYKLKNEIIQNDPAIQSGTVTAKDVARINKQIREAQNSFFEKVKFRKQLLEEAKKRGLL